MPTLDSDESFNKLNFIKKLVLQFWFDLFNTLPVSLKNKLKYNFFRSQA